ncbi:MAG TPA: hypothetical protein VFK35_04805 [Candidatus Limnocylindrales bacterium]|nr:hypothetical protein [Candidatus Limnocylindrales bacterium]
MREILEDAAIEPGGLERLMAGDTPTAALVASHLAACPDCAEELGRLHRTVGLVRPVLRSVPPPALRERTLAYVAALGRPRGVVAEVAAVPDATPALGARPSPAAVPGPTRPEPTARRRSRLPTLAGIAAALLIAVGGTALLVDADRQAALRVQAATIEALGRVASWTVRVDSRADARRVPLASPAGGPTTASVAFSPSTTELVVVAQLAPPPAGKEYRCWVEAGGSRASIGKMYFGGNVAYWVGDVPEVAGLGPDARFGVSLVDLTGGGAPGDPVLISGG